MAETAVKNETCRQCAADVRPDSEFCYNCGGALAPDAPEIIEAADDISSKETNKLKFPESPAAPAVEPAVKKEAKLKSAASMRRRSKIYQPKRVEVIWEEHENAPNGWFILTAVVLAIFAAVVFYLAIYLK